MKSCIACIPSHARWSLLLTLALSLALCGCRPVELPQPTEIVFPDEITISAQKWKKKTWGQQQDKRVAAFFSKRDYLADNPAFAGQRVCYVDERGQERCYWVTPGDGTNQWLYIEFKGNRALEPVEGVGEPFL